MSNVVQFSCPNCGGSLSFEPSAQRYTCDYCMSDFTQEEMDKSHELEAAAPADTYTVPNAQEQEEFNDHTNLYICDNCGAEIICEENTAATFCFYCHSPVALKGRLTGQCRPELVIPFKISREDAILEYKKWCGKKKFIPSDFTSLTTLEKITGLYVPYWLADCTVNAAMQGEAKIVHSHRSGNYEITNTKVFNVERAATLEYLGVPADASRQLDDRLMDSVEPFNYQEFKPFSMSYLAGFYADKYDVSKNEVLPRIRSRIEEGAQDVLMNDIHHYTSVVPRNRRTQIIRANWHYTMLPVWFLTYKYRGKSYFFGMNGQTGKITGMLPVSVPKLIALAAGLFVAVGLIAGLIGGAAV